MISDNPKLVTVFGGSGFLGRHVVQALTKRGYRVRVACRNPHTAQFVQNLGDMGQVYPVQANLRHRWSVERAVRGADHVINLVGIMNESGKQRFGAIHMAGARSIAEVALAEGIRLTHVSAIGADINAASSYARTKAQGEISVREILPDTVIVRPSIIFGPEDSFFNRFANLARFSPALPLIGDGQTRLQPAYVGNVAEVIARDVDGTLEKGATYEIGGPEIMTFRACMELTLAITGRRKALVSIPWPIAGMMGSILGLLPKPLLTKDQVVLLRSDNIVSEAARADGHTLEGLRIPAPSPQAILPSYLWSYRASGQYSQVQS